MSNLSSRSHQKELLDDPEVPFDEIMQNMKELNTVNSLLGGHSISASGIKAVAGQSLYSHPLSVCEIGCGGGDNLNAIEDWCRRKNIAPTFTGIDIKPACIQFAASQYAGLPCSWITNDYAKVNFSAEKPTIIFSSLFCHHFKDDEIVAMLKWMKRNSSTGFFINDLHRHPLAYFLIKWLTHFFSKSRLVKSDAPLSVARGFKRKEWMALLKSAGIKNYSIQWKWAFRYLIVCRNEA